MTPYLPALVGGFATQQRPDLRLPTNRVLVHESNRDRVGQQLVEYVSALKVGDPHQADTDFGPVASARQRSDRRGLHRVRDRAGARGSCSVGDVPATSLAAGSRTDDLRRRGSRDGEIAQEEILFGPVLSVITYSNEREAVAIANDSKYGLGGAVFAADTERGIEIASRINTGTFAVNGGPTVRRGSAVWRPQGVRTRLRTRRSRHSRPSSSSSPSRCPSGYHPANEGY